MWGTFLDFNFYKFNIQNSIYVEGFGKAYKKVF